MKKFKVEVLKRLYCRGTVEVAAPSQVAAEEKLQDQIDRGKMQTTDVEWGDPIYEDCSFGVETVDVED